MKTLLSSCMLCVACSACGLIRYGYVAEDPGQTEDSESPNELNASGFTRSFAAGSSHICIVLDGKLHCWGGNDHGQLGLGDFQARYRPAEVPLPFEAAQVCAGNGENFDLSHGHTCALSTEGELWCWGGNTRGQLGVGSKGGTAANPLRMGTESDWAFVSCGYEHTCAIKNDRSLWCWGSNAEGQLGLGTRSQQGDEDAIVPTLVPHSRGWRATSAGQGHSCAVDEAGELYCWGRNSNFQLGLGGGPDDGPEFASPSNPTRVGTGNDWVQVMTNQSASCGLRGSQPRAYCWGSGAPLGFSIGLNDSTIARSPTAIDFKEDIVSMHIGAFSACIVNSNQRLSCWGKNDAFGQLGLGDFERRDTPTQLSGSWSSVAIGRFFTCAQNTEGHVACAGRNRHGQLGLGEDIEEPINRLTKLTF